MIVIDLMGGLGNQLFQWALGAGLQARGRQVVYDASRLGPDKHRQFELGFLGVNPITNACCGRTVSEPGLRFHREILDSDHVRLVGYWQSEKYFAHCAENVKAAILRGAHAHYRGLCFSENSVALHVRRTDYTSESSQRFHGLMPPSYYQKAASHLREQVSRPHFYIFSDDVEWCKAEFAAWPDATIVDNSSPLGTLLLMASCHHAIIANSTFSWWGAWLQWPQGIVVAPERWFAAECEQANAGDIVPERWIKL